MGYCYSSYGKLNIEFKASFYLAVLSFSGRSLGLLSACTACQTALESNGLSMMSEKEQNSFHIIKYFSLTLFYFKRNMLSCSYSSSKVQINPMCQKYP